MNRRTDELNVDRGFRVASVPSVYPYHFIEVIHMMDLTPSTRSHQFPAKPVDELDRLSRRVKLFRRRGMLQTGEDSGLKFRRATDLDELREAYGLVHDVYVDQGYIRAQPGNLRLRVYEALPEMATFIAVDGDRVVGVMSVLPDSPTLGLPSDQAFCHELSGLRATGRRIGETTNLAVLAGYRNSNVFLELSRYCSAHAEAIGLDDLFVAVSPGHGMFFEEILQFDPMGELRDCGDHTVDLVVGKRLNLRRFEARLRALDQRLGEEAFLHDWFYQSNAYRFEDTHGDSTSWFLNPEMLRRLFAPVAHSISYPEQQLRALQEHWGAAMLRSVFSNAMPAR